MGNKIAKLTTCFAGDAGDISRRRNDAALCFDEGLGHSFCYIPPDPLHKIQSLVDPSTITTATAAVAAAQTTAFRTISGASISANTSTPLSTDPFPYNASILLDKASSFESSNFFSSIPLQPIPRNSITTVKSGPILRNSVPGSGPIERGFLSGPIERSFISGPLENQFDQLQRYRPKSKKLDFFKNLRKVLSKSFLGSSKELRNNENEHRNAVISDSGNSSTITSNNLSSDMSLIDENDDVGNESFNSQNVQWATGKAGEDRVHIVISEEHGWVFVGIYDGFNGPDATDFLLSNLYSNVYKELKGLLWCEKSDSCENTVNSSSFMSKSLDSKERVELDRKLREKLSNMGPDGIAGSKNNNNNDNNNTVVNHLGVLKALSEALRKTEASYLEITDMMLMENPELALMGSCVLAMVMKGDDVYLMNVGDSRAVLAQKDDSDSLLGKMRKDSEELLYGYEYETLHNLRCCQLTTDHSTSDKEEVRRIRNAHMDDASAVVNDRVKGSLKVTRAFGAGFLKQPKWNNAILEMFRIDYIGTLPYITCSPSLCHHRLDPNDKFLILSSDGLYQYFTNEEAISEVETFMSMFPEGDPAQHLVEEVLFRAAKKAGMDFHELLDIPQGDRRRYHDDVSIIIISFEGRIWRSSV